VLDDTIFGDKRKGHGQGLVLVDSLDRDGKRKAP